MKALVAVDGSDGGWEALRQTAALLSPDRDQLGLFYALPALRFRRVSVPSDEMMERSRQSIADAVFAKAREFVPVDFRKTLHSAVGKELHPRDGILLAANQWRANLIGMGARGTSAIAGMLLGSVSRWVVHRSTVPVLVARAGLKRVPGFRMLLAAGSAHLESATCRLINDLRWPENAHGYLLHVVPSLSVGQLPDWLEEQARRSTEEPSARRLIEERDAEVREAQEIVRREQQRLPAAFQRESAVVTQGQPADQILRLIAAEEIEIVIVGAKSSSPVERLLLGSTLDTVMNQAACSVLVVPKQQPL